jgi:hypothetical protein
LSCEAAAAARDRLTIPAPGDPARQALTVAEWLEIWVTTRARLRDSTRRGYRTHIRVHFRRHFDGVLLAELDTGNVERAFRRMFEAGMTAATAQRLLATLRSALNAAVRERLIGDSPARCQAAPWAQAACGGVDPAAGAGVAADGVPACGGGVDPGADRRVPGRDRRSSAVRRLPSDRDARAPAR